MKVCAAILKELGKPLCIEEVVIPVLKEGQILVKMAYSGVCHSQLMEVRGKRGKDKYLPHMLGHEGTGIVIEIGKGVTKVKVDDWVILGWINGNGIDGGSTQYEGKNGVAQDYCVYFFKEKYINY